MIRSFADKHTAQVWDRERSRRMHPDTQAKAWQRLSWINRAGSLNDLLVPPSNRLEKLRGDRAGQYSIRINQQWRVCFRWSDGGAYDVEIVDYHP